MRATHAPPTPPSPASSQSSAPSYPRAYASPIPSAFPVVMAQRWNWVGCCLKHRPQEASARTHVFTFGTAEFIREGKTYAPPTPPSPASSPTPSANYRRPADVLILLVRLGSPCATISLRRHCSFFHDADGGGSGG